MPQTPNALDTAIASVHDQLRSLLGDASKAASALKDAVSAALARVTGKKDGRRTRSAGAVPAKKATAKKTSTGGARGPKPGGRQLKAHVGAKAFEAMDATAKDGARKAISAVAAEWKEMSASGRDDVIAKFVKHSRKVEKSKDVEPTSA